MMHVEDTREIAKLKYPVLDTNRIVADLDKEAQASRFETGAWLLCSLFFACSHLWLRNFFKYQRSKEASKCADAPKFHPRRLRARR